MTAAHRPYPEWTTDENGTPVRVTPPGAKPRRDEAAAPRRLQPVPMLTVQEVAAALRVSRQTVYRMVHAEEIPSVRVGRSVRVPETALQRWMGGEE